MLIIKVQNKFHSTQIPEGGRNGQTLTKFILNNKSCHNSNNSDQYAISKIKMLCNLRCLKARLRLLCSKLSTAQQPEPRFKTVLNYLTFLFSKWRTQSDEVMTRLPSGSKVGPG